METSRRDEGSFSRWWFRPREVVVHPMRVFSGFTFSLIGGLFSSLWNFPTLIFIFFPSLEVKVDSMGFEEVYICEPAGNGFVIWLRAPRSCKSHFPPVCANWKATHGCGESPAHVMVELGGDTWIMSQIECM